MNDIEGRKHPGIKRPFFPLPSADTIEGYQCVKLSIPDSTDYRIALISALNLLTYWFNWERDSEHRGKEVADIWREVLYNLSWENACCPPVPNRQRITPDGHYQVSYDNGETWEDAPDLDPRETSIQFPEQEYGPGTNEKCAAAENVMQGIKSQLEQSVDELNLGVSLVALIASILAVVAVFMSGGTLAPLVTALGGALFGAGSVAIEAAFTSEVWDDFRCIVYTHIPDDGVFTQAAIDAIWAQIGDDFIGIVVTILRSYVEMFGAVGMTNLGRTGSADGTDCADCDGEWCWTIDFTENDQEWSPYLAAYYAEYYSGQGWGADTSTADDHVCYIQSPAMPDMQLTRVEVHCTSAPQAFTWLQGFDGVSGVIDEKVNDPDAVTIYEPEAPLEFWEVNNLRVLIQSGEGTPPYPDLTAKIFKIVLYGIGSNPFGTDNC